MKKLKPREKGVLLWTPGFARTRKPGLLTASPVYCLVHTMLPSFKNVSLKFFREDS